MTILLDMNLSPRWKLFLEQHGFPAHHWSSLGPADASDHTLMQLALIEHFVVLTQDLDFGIALVAAKRNRPSVVQLRSVDLAPEIIGSQVLTALQRFASELKQGALLTIDPKRTRLRILATQLDI